LFCFFFFQAEDGIRDRTVTGVQTCALPIYLLRMVLAYCLGKGGLRLTAAWAASIGLVDISNVALLHRLRRCGDWLALLVGQALRSEERRVGKEWRARGAPVS